MTTFTPDDLTGVGGDLYAALEPLTREDEALGYPLAIYAQALGHLFQEVVELARDTTARPGWSALMDPATAPDDALGWLAQLVGVSIPLGTAPADARAAILARTGFERGTPDALVVAAQRTLTGDRHVLISERYGGNAWALGVFTLASETPSEAATLAAILEQKPAGITLTYETVTGQTYATLLTVGTYATVNSTYDTYGDVAADTP